jgi:hypothetical protein
MNRVEKFLAIFAYAQILHADRTTKTFDELADWLNANGITTSYGTVYCGGRGVARLIDAVYNFVCDELDLGEKGAYPVAVTFTDRNGHYSYEVATA